MQGLHLTADLYRCRCQAQWLTEAAQVARGCRDAAQAAGLAAGGELVQDHPRSPQGPAGVAAALLLGDAHLCLHTWPGTRTVTADVYVPGADAASAARAHGLVEALVARFAPEWTEQRSLDRGGEAS